MTIAGRTATILRATAVVTKHNLDSSDADASGWSARARQDSREPAPSILPVDRNAAPLRRS